MGYSTLRATWWYCDCYHEEQLNLLINSLDVRGYAWILHDKDVGENGILKKPHYHVLVQLYGQQRGSWFRQFSSDDMGMILHQPCYSPQGAFDYLTHDTPASIKAGKYRYDVSEVHSTLESFVEEIEENKKLSNLDLRKLILEKNLTPSQLKLNYNISLNQMKFCDEIFNEYNKTLYEGKIRNNINCTYLYGRPRVGKTSLIFEKLLPPLFYRVTNYKHPFDEYAYQKIIVFDEFDSQVSIELMNDILDRWPCQLPCRFRNKWAACETVFVLSNLPLERQYLSESREKREAFFSRFHKVEEIYSDIKKELKRSKPLTAQELQEDDLLGLL